MTLPAPDFLYRPENDLSLVLALYRVPRTRAVALDLADRNCAMAGHVPAPRLNDNTREERDDRASAR